MIYARALVAYAFVLVAQSKNGLAAMSYASWPHVGAMRSSFACTAGRVCGVVARPGAFSRELGSLHSIHRSTRAECLVPVAQSADLKKGIAAIAFQTVHF